MKKHPFNGMCVGPKSYRLCQALAQRSVDQCNALKGACDPQTVKSCVRAYYGVASLMELKRNPAGAESLCEKNAEESHLPMSEGNISRMCRMFNEGVLSAQSPSQACRKVMAAVPSLSPDFLKGCIHEMRFLSGPNACVGPHDRPDLDDGVCAAKAGIARAVSSGDPSACGSSVICRAALSHSTGICESLKQKAVQDYCSRSAATQFPGMIHQEASFRRYNHLPPYKDGDKFLNFLPPPEKEKYYDKKRMRSYERTMMKRRLPPPSMPPPPGSSNAPDSGE